MGNQDEVLDLIGRIYQAALVPAEWGAVLGAPCGLDAPCCDLASGSGR